MHNYGDVTHTFLVILFTYNSACMSRQSLRGSLQKKDSCSQSSLHVMERSSEQRVCPVNGLTCHILESL